MTKVIELVGHKRAQEVVNGTRKLLGCMYGILKISRIAMQHVPRSTMKIHANTKIHRSSLVYITKTKDAEEVLMT